VSYMHVIVNEANANEPKQNPIHARRTPSCQCTSKAHEEPPLGAAVVQCCTMNHCLTLPNEAHNAMLNDANEVHARTLRC
jgi:hypothetical protein